MAAFVTDDALAKLLPGLITPEVIYFPIRHHSPACSWHLEQLIRERKPRAVLVEGPAAFTALIPLLLHPKTRAPVALYTSFVGEEVPGSPFSGVSFGPPRFAAYYPFCDYSPELVALRVGAETGASLRFIDLDYPDQVRAAQPAADAAGGPRVESLLAERHFRRSRFLGQLARRAGCRDHNDLWDHLFETRLAPSASGPQNGGQFIRDVTAWCYFARLDATPEELKADGTLEREAAMAANVRAELANRNGAGPVLVVTGGFHTVALPALVAQEHPVPAATKQDTLTCLVRYSFEQLDALNGYAAGMPSPFYYDQVWRLAAGRRAEPPLNRPAKPAARKGTAAGNRLRPEPDSPEPFTDLAAKILVQLGQLTRRKKLATALSPADEIAALEQARRLAALRGHPGPTREDLLDGVRSCFVKGAMDAEGEILLGLAHHALAGASIGEVPAEAGVPPLVEDFRTTARALRLNISDSVRRKNSLDLYRKSSHRKASRFFHSLGFLGVPFATMVAGPDFVNGTGLERLQEHWDYQWSPQTESQLVEASIYGANLEAAAANRLLRATAELESRGRGRSAAAAVAVLVQACRMGLHRHTDQVRSLIATEIGADPQFPSLAQALNQLGLLWESREPLEAHRLPDIPALIKSAYVRACYLLHDLGGTPPDAADETLQALIVMRDVLHGKAASDERLDPELFFAPLRSALRDPKAPALLAGGAAGMLHGADRLGEDELLRVLSGFLNSAAVQPGEQMAFLVGLLRTCRELAWRQPALTQAIESLLGTWNEEEFLGRLPHLRLAFAGLTPRETDQVAGVIAGRHGGEKLGPLIEPGLSEQEMLTALRLDLTVRKAVEQDGLAGWLQAVRPVAEPTGAT